MPWRCRRHTCWHGVLLQQLTNCGTFPTAQQKQCLVALSMAGAGGGAVMHCMGGPVTHCMRMQC